MKGIQLLLLFAGIFFLAGYTSADETLSVFGPGGPYGPMNESATVFSQRYGAQVIVKAGPEKKWIDEAKQKADVIFGGAEFMLSKFIQNHSGLIDTKTRTTLYVRPSGILVRPGNPKQIHKFEDLYRPDIKIMVVVSAGQTGLWEDMTAKHGDLPKLIKNIAVYAINGADAIRQWKEHPDLDAWMTWESWHYRLKDVTELVQVDENYKIFRGTPIAITKISQQRELAQEFIDFLKSDEAHAIFKKWGWK
ncbi:MAG: substrate-binding domain-containing protein [Nitrospirota bacterium]|nr:substrate-binding domain-containing protein [Nitrospirota bacterium]